MGHPGGRKRGDNSGIQALGARRRWAVRRRAGRPHLSNWEGRVLRYQLEAVTVPVDVISSRLMAQATQPAHAPRYKGGFDALVTILRTEGASGLYRGFGMSLLTLWAQQLHVVGHLTVPRSDSSGK